MKILVFHERQPYAFFKVSTDHQNLDLEMEMFVFQTIFR